MTDFNTVPKTKQINCTQIKLIIPMLLGLLIFPKVFMSDIYLDMGMGYNPPNIR